MKKPAYELTNSREQIARDIRVVSGTEEGERVIGYLLRFCHVHRDSVADDQPHFDTNRTFFNEGQRSVGNEIVALIVNEPDRFKAPSLRRVTALAEGTTD